MSDAGDLLVAITRDGVAALRRPFVSLLIVGSATTKEYSPRRTPPPDLDLLVIVEGAAVTAEESHQLRRKITGVSGLPFRIGARLRATQEIPEFDVHMASWGYDLREARCLAGIPTEHFVEAEPPPVPPRYLFRNLLCQLWRSVAEADSGSEQAYRLSRDVCEFMNLCILAGGTFRPRLRQRLDTFQMLHGAICRSGANVNAAQLAVDIRLGNKSGPIMASALQSLRELRDTLLAFLSGRMDEIPPGDGWIERWVPGPVASSLGVLSWLDATATAVFLDQVWTSARGYVDTARVFLSALALGGDMPPAFPDDCLAEFGALRRRFATIQMERCDLARRDLRHHLGHLLDAPRPVPCE